MDVERKQPRLLILSGPVAVVEERLNRLLDDYSATVWNFLEVDGAVWCNVVLISDSELRKASLRQGGMSMRVRP